MLLEPPANPPPQPPLPLSLHITAILSLLASVQLMLTAVWGPDQLPLPPAKAMLPVAFIYPPSSSLLSRAEWSGCLGFAFLFKCWRLSILIYLLRAVYQLTGVNISIRCVRGSRWRSKIVENTRVVLCYWHTNLSYVLVIYELSVICAWWRRVHHGLFCPQAVMTYAGASKAQ